MILTVFYFWLFPGRRGRGGKRNHDQDSKPSPSRIMHQGLLESEIGITEYITPGPGFKGIIKQRLVISFQVYFYIDKNDKI